MTGERKSILSWCLYDWGVTAFPTVIVTFIYSVYFGRKVVGDETLAASKWSFALAAAGLTVGVLSPVLGAIADHYGARKPWVLLFTALFIVPAALLYDGVPGASSANIAFILAMIILSNIAYEIALVFNNAMLPAIAPPALLGRISGWAWGMGYMGGLCCLVIALFGLIGLGGFPPLLHLPTAQAENVRATAILVAVWAAVFTVPFALFTHDVPRTGLGLAAAAREGLRQLRQTIETLPRHGNLLRFLIASAIYRDGLNTLFAMGGLYAAGEFGMGFQDILVFAIGLNVTAGLGAASLALVDDWKGSRPTILISLCGLLVSGTAVLLIHDKTLFMAASMALGLFIGPAQSASRTLAARLSAPGMVGQTYGLYSLTGRASAFLGPAAYGWAVLAFGNQRAGMATILLFWLAGMVLLFTVKEQQRDKS